MSFIICPHCGTETERGYSVCRGCQAEVIYGAKPSEILWGAMIIGGILAYLTNKLFSATHVTAFQSIGSSSFIIFAALAAFAIHRTQRFNIRFFRNYRHK